MADAQTPVLTDEQIDAAVAAWFADLDDGHPHSFKERMRCAILAAQAPARPDRAVMQQALDALRAVKSNMLQNAPYLSGKAWGDADAAIAALSATMEKPNGN